MWKKSSIDIRGPVYRFFALWLLVGGVLTINSTLLAEGSIPLSEEFSALNLGKYVEVYLDQAGSTGIADIRSGKLDSEFKKSTEENVNQGFTDAIAWIRFNIVSELDHKEDFLLEIAYPPLDSIELHIQDQNGTMTLKRGGDLLPFTERDIEHRNFIFVIPIEAHETKTLYLRIQTESSMQIPLTLWSNGAFLQKDHNEQNILGVYYGIMYGMLIYNLFIYFTVRDPSYLYYVVFIFIYSLMQTTLDGFAYENLWPGLTWWNNKCLILTIMLGVASSLLFTRSLLNLPQDAPRLNKLTVILIAILSLVGFASLGIPYSLGLKIGILPGLIGIVVMLATGVYRLLQGYKPARYFLLAWTALLIGVLLIILKAAHILPANLLTNYGMQVGSALEVVLLSFALGEKINLMREEKEEAQRETLEGQRQAMEAQKRMMDSFSRFVPMQFLTFLEKKSVIDVQLGDAVLRKSMTVLFTDIRDFTTMSESMTPAENFKFLNSLLKRMEPHIDNHNGFVDKFVGDAIMALFSESPDDALHSSIEMNTTLRSYNQRRLEVGYAPIDMGIGVNCGELVLGTVGSNNRIDTTVIGDSVNLASRMEGLTKMFQVSIMVSQSAVEQLHNPDDFCLRRIDTVAVKGKSLPVDIYELFDIDPPELIESKIKYFPQLRESIEVYKTGKFREAHKMLREYYKSFPEDHIAKIYLKRCKFYIQHPPGEAWTGVSVLSKK